MPNEDSKLVETAEAKYPLKTFNPYEKYTPDEIRAFNEMYFAHLLQETQIADLQPKSEYDDEGNPLYSENG